VKTIRFPWGRYLHEKLGDRNTRMLVGSYEQGSGTCIKAIKNLLENLTLTGKKKKIHYGIED